MQHCRAFLHPAVFEGFGIPPLEALSQGARILLSNASCLPELYGDTAAYFDPQDYQVDLDALLHSRYPNRINCWKNTAGTKRPASGWSSSGAMPPADPSPGRDKTEKHGRKRWIALQC